MDTPRGRISPEMRAWREYAQISLASGTDLGPDEIADRVASGAISRRDLFKMGGTLAAGLALAACSGGDGGTASSPTPVGSAASSGDGPSVFVVGAGLAGLTAAYRLSQAGIDVRLYEAQDRIGGRAWTVRGFESGQTSEHGGEFVDTRHVQLRGLVKDLGLELEDLWKGWEPGTAWITHLDGKIIRGSEYRDEQAPIVSALKKEAERLGVTKNGKNPDYKAMSYGTATSKAIGFDQLSMLEWLEKEFPGTAQDPVGRLLNNSMEGWYGLGMDRLSALNWMDYFIIPWPGGDERYHVKGGSDMVPRALVDALPEGALTRGAPLEYLKATSDGRYELGFAGQEPVAADHVILATPILTLNAVDLSEAGFDEQRMDVIKNHSAGMNTKLHLQFDGRMNEIDTPEGMWGGTADVDGGFSVWDSTPVQPGDNFVVTCYGGGLAGAQFANDPAHAVPPDSLVDATLKKLDAVTPGVSERYNGKSYADYWPADPVIPYSYAAFGPGQVTKYWGYTGKAEGNVHFAGEHTSTYSQGFLNGGVESGQRTAIEVMDALGVEVPEKLRKMPYSAV